MSDLAMRRRTNQAFLYALEEVQLNRPLTLVWLKKEMEFDICETMLTDWKFSGEIFEHQNWSKLCV